MVKKLNLFLYRNYGVDLSRYEESFLDKTIIKRISSLSLLLNSDYLEHIKNNENEVEELTNSLHVNFSEFFRNQLTFSVLESIIIPELIEAKKNKKELRVWSAACASGQEAYSMAISINEFIKDNAIKQKFRIFASDVSDNALAQAKEGIFTEKEIDKVTLRILNLYFKKHGQKFSVIPLLKENIDFSKFDLISDPNFCPPTSIYGNFDVIFCCNILFYYTIENKKIIIDKLTRCLDKNGYIIVGDTERELIKGMGFKEIIKHSCIFIK